MEGWILCRFYKRKICTIIEGLFMPNNKVAHPAIELSIVVPAYNEENSIANTIQRLQHILREMNLSHEIIIVNDGSIDQTLVLLRKIKGITVVSHPSNRGYGASLKTGLRTAKGEWIGIVDADGTYPIESIPLLWQHHSMYDMVVGARDPNNQHIRWTRKPGKWVLGQLANYLVGKKIPDLNSGMRIFRKELAMEFYHLYPQGFSFTITITLASMVNQYAVKYIPIHYQERQGKSKMNVIKDGLNFIGLIFRIITYFNPGKILIPLGLLFFVIGAGVAWYSYFVLGRFMDITVVLLLLAGIQIFVFSLIANLIVKMRGTRVQ